MRNSPLKSMSKDELESIISKCNTFREVLDYIGYKGGGSYQTLKNRIEEYNIDCSHMTHTNNNLRKRKLKAEDLLIENCPHSNSSLRRYIISNNIIPYRCVHCGNTGEWNNKPLTLTLDHKNGIHNDNRLENLQFVCPNCDSQQDTYCGKNKTRYYQKYVYPQKKHCIDCGIEISRKATRCVKCSNIYKNRNKIINNITKKDLQKLIQNTPFTTIGKIYNVTDNTVRKWCKKFGLPYRVKDIRVHQ